MENKDIETLEECFADLEDPRVDRTKLYPLMEIIFIVLTGTICGADSWRDFADFGSRKLDYLKRFFSFTNGIPSKNTFARVLSAIDPEQFKQCFLKWVKMIQIGLQEVIAIDGKTVRGSFDKSKGQNPLHLVNAFATSLRLVLGQEKVNDKSNEITAIPALLNLLEITGAIVSIDAMGCQKEIASMIREKGADYILSLKGNQGTLHDDVKLFLETQKEKAKSEQWNHYEDIDKGHGRVEIRHCFVSGNVDWLTQKANWKDLKTIIMIESTREIAGHQTQEKRFYISSLPPNAEWIGGAIRSHWGIENSLHWVLDVTFGEDYSRVREKNAAENMSLIRKLVLNMLQNTKKKLKI
jgi:predicted transposase YbfD/YdcC